MNPNQFYIDQKAQQAILTLDAARARAGRERTLLELALMVSRVHVNHLVKPLPTVRASLFRLRAESERRAAQLAAALVMRLQAEPRSAENAQLLADTCEACRKVFPREARLLQRLRDEDAPRTLAAAAP
ncbi:MAG: hypothetical protein ABSH23_03665 [Steroidobacteraceae bacterium]|jgi:hypothetical protein